MLARAQHNPCSSCLRSRDTTYKVWDTDTTDDFRQFTKGAARNSGEAPVVRLLPNKPKDTRASRTPTLLGQSAPSVLLVLPPGS